MSQKAVLKNKIADIAILLHRQSVFSELVAFGRLPRGTDPDTVRTAQLVATLEELCLCYVEEVNGKEEVDDAGETTE